MPDGSLDAASTWMQGCGSKNITAGGGETPLLPIPPRHTLYSVHMVMYLFCIAKFLCDGCATHFRRHLEALQREVHPPTPTASNRLRRRTLASALCTFSPQLAPRPAAAGGPGRARPRSPLLMPKRILPCLFWLRPSSLNGSASSRIEPAVAGGARREQLAGESQVPAHGPPLEEAAAPHHHRACRRSHLAMDLERLPAAPWHRAPQADARRRTAAAEGQPPAPLFAAWCRPTIFPPDRVPWLEGEHAHAGSLCLNRMAPPSPRVVSSFLSMLRAPP